VTSQRAFILHLMLFREFS